jgi:outer membrane protein assembly factor BamB
MRALLAAVVLVAGISGCGADAEPEDHAPTGPRQLEIADRFVHTGEPDFLLDAFGAIWSVTASGYLLRLDPDTGELLDTYDSGYHSMPACNGDGFDDSALWICSGPDHLARVDPETGAATPVPAHKRGDQTRFPFAGGLLWYLETETNDLVGLDGSGAEGARVPLGMVCTTATSDDATIWVLCPTDGKVVQVDAAKAEVVGSIEVVNPRQAAVADDLFVGSGDDLVQIDTGSLEVLHTYDGVGPGTYGDIDATADEVWVRREGGPFLTGIDPSAHEVVATVDAPDIPGGGDVLITDDWIWASSFDDNVVVRVAR